MPLLMTEPDLRWLTERSWTCQNCEARISFSKDDINEITIVQSIYGDNRRFVINFESPCPFCRHEALFQ